MLDRLYEELDRLAEKYGVYKVLKVYRSRPENPKDSLSAAESLLSAVSLIVWGASHCNLSHVSTYS